MPHVEQPRWDNLQGDITAAAAYLRVARIRRRARSSRPASAWAAAWRPRATLGLGLAGVDPVLRLAGRPEPERLPARRRRADQMTATVLGLFGGADEGLSPAVVATFEEALAAAGVEHQLITYPGAPHSFFDRRADEYARRRKRAWADTLGFIRDRTPA